MSQREGRGESREGKRQRITHEKVFSVGSHAQAARRSLTSLERRFHRDVKQILPHLSWRRYHPVTIRAHPEHKSTWYAPFLNIPHKLIAIIEHRDDFPYRVYGQNGDLYARHGYTVLDFSEDCACPTDDSVWHEILATVRMALQR